MIATIAMPPYCQQQQRRNADLDGDLTERAGSLRAAERSFCRIIKDFDVVDGEPLCAGPSISTGEESIRPFQI